MENNRGMDVCLHMAYGSDAHFKNHSGINPYFGSVVLFTGHLTSATILLIPLDT